MYRFSVLPIFAIFVSLLMISCSNPADNVTEATVSGASSGEEIVPFGDKYTIAETSTIGFVGSKVTGSHTGGFKSFTGEFFMEGNNIESAKGKVVIDIDSMFTDSERLTGHLKSKDFFEVETYPTAAFTCSSVKKQGETYLVSGTLDMHGVAKSIEFPAKITQSADNITLNAEFFIKRFDWGIVYAGKADDLIRDEVVIKLNLNAVKG